MGKRSRYHDHIDPAYREWGQKYREFPGVAECARRIKKREGRGCVGDIVVFELAQNASTCLPDLIECFNSEPEMRFIVLMALEIAQLPESASFFAEVLREGNPRYTPFAERGLRAIDTPESRKALWEAGIR